MEIVRRLGARCRRRPDAAVAERILRAGRVRAAAEDRATLLHPDVVRGRMRPR